MAATTLTRDGTGWPQAVSRGLADGMEVAADGAGDPAKRPAGSTGSSPLPLPVRSVQPAPRSWQHRPAVKPAPQQHHLPHHPRPLAPPAAAAAAAPHRPQQQEQQPVPVLAGGQVELTVVQIQVPQEAILHHSARSLPTLELGVKPDSLAAASSTTTTTATTAATTAAIALRQEVKELKVEVKRLEESERRLMEDKESVVSQLRSQTEVNRELKKLLVASVGDDLQFHFERAVRERGRLQAEAHELSRSLAASAEQLERSAIQCDVWRSKFLASRVMSEELAGARVHALRSFREAQGAVHDLFSERTQLCVDLQDTHRLLEELVLALQWGRQPTYSLGATRRARTSLELAEACATLAALLTQRLLGGHSGGSLKSSPPPPAAAAAAGAAAGGAGGGGAAGATVAAAQAPAQLCSTAAERMAQQVLRMSEVRMADPMMVDDAAGPGAAGRLLPGKPSAAGRFHPYTHPHTHPYTRQEHITFTCCRRCTGDIIVV